MLLPMSSPHTAGLCHPPWWFFFSFWVFDSLDSMCYFLWLFPVGMCCCGYSSTGPASWSVGPRATPEGQVHWFWISPLLLFHQSVSWESWHPGSLFSSFFTPRTLCCAYPAGMKTGVGSTLLPTFQAGNQLGKLVASNRIRNPTNPTVLRNSPLCFSTSRKIRYIECQTLCFSPNTS